MKKILLAEDDENLGAILQDYLKDKGFEASLAVNGEEALKQFMRETFDLCILDVMMPLKDGYTLAREIRAQNKSIPIIFLTAKSMKEDAIEGFKIGADDYVTKPFSMEELLLRMQAILRRIEGITDAPKESNVFTIGNSSFDYLKQEVTVKGNVTKLTTKEAELLKLLCKHVNKVLDRNLALKVIWNDDSYFNSRSMDVYVTKLRKHLKPDDTLELVNVHGKGFKLLDTA